MFFPLTSPISTPKGNGTISEILRSLSVVIIAGLLGGGLSVWMNGHVA
jgi:hypothetical protein